MSVHCELYGWRMVGDAVEITYQIWREFFGMVTSQDFIRYDGKKQEDGTMLWLRDDGEVVSEKMERSLNRTHQKYCKKHSIAA